jgi:CHASE2 domain
MTSKFFLKVHRVQQSCLFELTWDQGRRITAEVPYPETLTSLFRDWQEAYLKFHSTGQRARPGGAGVGIMPAIDWRAKLVQAEAGLLYEFHHWLNHAKLAKIRSTLAQLVADVSESFVEIFLTCEPIEIIRLPWEAWEIATEFASSKSIRFIRMPSNISSVPSVPSPHRKQMRILAILGDDTGLNFEQEKAALKSLKLAAVEFVGWQPSKPTEDVKEAICQAISDEMGWDVLFFAGHSNESTIAGGELGIAPNQSMLMQELVPYLQKAQKRGLQAAVFNSCKGINIAQTLIDVGLNEVAVMREPISNAVAQEFLVQFVKSLAQLNDVHKSLLDTCDYLKRKKSLTYPSAYLIPSIFRHSQSRSFQPDFKPWRQRLRQWLPTKREKVALAACLLLSVLPPVRSLLLDQRLLAQSIYRQTTGQLPKAGQPPVTLVQIDEASLQKAGISQPVPMDRQYLANLVDRLTQRQAKVVGLDYFLDRPQPNNDGALATAIRNSVTKNGTWFVFGAFLDVDKNGKQVLIEPSTKIASPSWSLQGYTNSPRWYVQLPHRGDQSPFAYTLAIAAKLQQSPDMPQPRMDNQSDFFSMQVRAAAYIASKADGSIKFLQPLQESWLTQFSRLFEQIWGQPILDFSIPPDRAFRAIPAWHLLDEQKSREVEDLSNTIVMIAPGGYGEAGVQLQQKDYKDTFDPPAAIAYWQNSSYFTGGEALAYMTHHLLKQWLVIPVPDLWMVLLTAVAVKGLQLWPVRYRRIALMGGTVTYGLISLQLFISVAIVLPIVLPGLLLGLYYLPWKWGKANE